MKILLLEDDVILSEIISEHLLERGFELECFDDGIEAFDAISSCHYDLLLLDVNVASLSGFELLQALRDQSIKTPAIFITSLNSSQDLKKGFEIGADDYLKKPFELVELDARMDHIAKIYSLSGDTIEIANGITLDRLTQEIISGKTRQKISKKELDVVLFLHRHKDRFVTSGELMANVWIDSDPPTEATLRTYIKNLRSYLGKESIETIKGVGYKFKL